MSVQNIFITGGTTGIGLALAKHYVALGCRVGIFSRDEKKWLVNDISKNPLTTFYTGSIENKDEIKNAVSSFVKKFGQLNLMIANAGLGNTNKNPIPDFILSEKILKINVLGTLYTIEAAFEHQLANRSGQIAVIASVAGYVGLNGNAAYCGSKAALHKMCESYAIDFAKFGITVTCISPGFVDTPMTKANTHTMPFIMSPEKAATIIAQAIKDKKHWLGFPLANYGLMVMISLLPRAFYIWLSQKLNLNFYKKGKT